MLKITTRIITFATIVLSPGFVVTGPGYAFAHQGQTEMTRRAAVHRHPGYAGPTYLVVRDCDLPSSGCSNDERITN